MNLLKIDNLKTSFKTDDGIVQAVRGISFHIDKGEAVGIVGESGCGKSVTMLSLLGLNSGNAIVEADDIDFDGVDLLELDNKSMRALLGNEISMIFQDPMTSLNPLYTVGNQLMEPLKIHQKMDKKQAYARAIELLNLVQMPAPESRMKQYPFEFSGGMRQRIMIAIAMACNPKLLIADEPTTALDMTIQAQILDLMKNVKEKTGSSIVMITHDLGVIINMCSRVMVMYAGLIIEEGLVEEIFANPQHPYTLGLIRSLPKFEKKRSGKLYSIPGSPPDLLKPPTGCPFADRCEHTMKVCKLYMPEKKSYSDTHHVCCWLSRNKEEVV